MLLSRKQKMMPANKPELIHANALALGDYGVLILGATGAGKSLLTLTLIERAYGARRHAQLVADDYCEMTSQSGKLIARAPHSIRGAMEIRGAGLFSLPYQESVALDLVVELVASPPRYPDEADIFNRFGHALPCLRLPRLDGATPVLAVCHAIEAHLFRPRWHSPF